MTKNDKTGEPVEPNLQLVEMGRDMPHADGNLTNLAMMCKTIDFQGTKVDPASGTVTEKPDGVSPVHFLDNRLAKGVALSAKYNLGYGLTWVPTYSETDPKHHDYLARYDYISPRGRGMGVGAGSYYFYKGIGLDLTKSPYRYIQLAFDGTASVLEWGRSGQYLDSLHNYGFDFWIGLPASASDAAPDPQKASRALAKVLAPLPATPKGAPAKPQEVENRFFDLSANAQSGDIYPGSPNDVPLQVSSDADGTGFVRMTVDQAPRTMVLRSRFPKGVALRVRSNALVKLSFYRDEDFTRRGCLQDVYLPNTQGQWRNVVAAFEGDGLIYVQATPLSGPAMIDFDRIEMEKSAVPSLAFEFTTDQVSLRTFVGQSIQKTLAVTGSSDKVVYSAVNLPAGAEVAPASGAISWTPTAAQRGDHTAYLVASDGDTLRALKISLHVAANLQTAMVELASKRDPAAQYTTVSDNTFKAAVASGKLDELQRAVEGLELLNPRLPDGTLDFRTASCPPEYGAKSMADNDPFTWGGSWGFDKNVTLDFGSPYKVKVEAFRILPRDGHPSRIVEAVVYGSNDRKHWTLLTQVKAKSTSDFQTLTLKEEERGKPYRYLRLFKNAQTAPIFEAAEFRIVGQRVEDFSPDMNFAYISGYDDGTFRPDRTVTKSAAASMLAGLIDDYTDKGAYTCDFVDVPKTAPYYDDVAYMSSKGIGRGWAQPVKYITGDSEKRFHPGAAITRGELAAIMARMQH